MKTAKISIAILTLAAALAFSRQLAAQGPDEPPPAAPEGVGSAPQGSDGVKPDEPPPIVTPTDEEPPPDPVAVFHDPLANYGHWTERPEFGQVWVPSVPAGWRPYTTGHRASTDQGWAWVADEPWGWATFHYGRWFYATDLGWAWVPGTLWAPAWVAWRQGGGYLGWAPLPPTVAFSVEVGLGLGARSIRPGYFTFVSERNFLVPRVRA